MIEGLSQAARYALLAGALLAVVALAGWALVARASAGLPLCERLATAVVAATSVVVVASTWWAYRGTANGPVVVAFAVLGAVGLVVLGGGVWRSWQGRPPSALPARAANAAELLVGALAVGLVQYWPVFRSGFLPGFVTAFTNPNNDIAIYVLQGDNVLRRGFGEYGRVSSFAIGEWTKGDHTGTSTFLAAAARLLGVTTWQMAIPFMVFVIAATALVVAALVQRCGRVGRIGVGATVLWALAAPFPSAVQSDYFLGQALSRLLVLAQVLFVLQLLGRGRTDRPLLPIALLALTTSAGFLAYPAGEVSALALVVAVSLALMAAGWCFESQGGARRALMLRSGGLVGAVAVGTLSVAPRWGMIVDTVRLYSNPDITGFPLPTARFRFLAGIGSAVGSWSAWGTPLVVATFTAGAIGIVCLARRDRRRVVEILCLTLPAAGGYLLLAVVVGSSAYQAWKFLGTAQPLVIVGVASFVVEGTRVVGRAVSAQMASTSAVRLGWLAGASVVGVAGFALATSQATWREAVQTRAAFSGHEVTAALVGARHDRRVRVQRNLRIALAPYFETMVAPVVLDVRGAHFAAPTYRGPASADGRCVLTRLANHPELDRAQYDRVAGDLSIRPKASCTPQSRTRSSP